VAYEKLERFIWEQDSRFGNKTFVDFIKNNEAISVLELEIERLKATDAEKLKEISQLNLKIKIFNDENYKKAKEISELQSKINDLKTEQSKYLKQISSLTTEIKDLKLEKLKKSKSVSKLIIFTVIISSIFGFIVYNQIQEIERLQNRDTWIDVPMRNLR
jgi:chromosome segregation ATPase